MALYTVYRPKEFSDVCGQEHIVSTLSQAIEKDKLSHAYLFCGSRGIGKTTVARILAKNMLIRGIEDAKIREQILHEVDAGNLIDLIEIDAASNRGIDDIRDLLEKIQFSPVVAGAKVYIIDEVHMLTKEAFNALLKTLEEPPAYAYFILATTELFKIPATIQSRCQRFLFRQVGESDIVARLMHVAKEEGVTYDDGVLEEIARHAEGGMRDALSLLDQLCSLEHITRDDVRKRIGESGQEYVEAMLSALVSQDAKQALDLVHTLEKGAVPLETFTRLLLRTVRMKLHSAIEAGEDPAFFLRVFDTLLLTIRDLRIAPVPGLVLESAFLSLCSNANSTQSQVAASVQQVASVPQQAPTPAESAPTPVSAPSVATPVPASPSPAPAQSAAAVSETGSSSLASLVGHWESALQQVDNAAARMSLKNGRLVSVEGGVLRIAFASAFHKEKASNTDASRKIEEALQKATGEQVRLECILEADLHATQNASAALPAQSAPSEEVVDLASAAGEIF